MFESIVAVAVAFAIFSGYLAYNLGRSLIGWGALCLVLGPVGVLITLVLEPLPLARRTRPWARSWLVLSAAAGLSLLGALIGVLLAVGETGANPVHVGNEIADSSNLASVGPALGIMAGGATALWGGFVFLLGGVLGMAAGLTISPFIALALESRSREV